MRAQQVIAEESSTPINLVNSNGIEFIGNVISRKFVGEQVVRHLFEPTNGDNKTYNLKPTSEKFSIFSHDQALAPLTGAGWKIEKSYLNKGGLSLNTVLTPSAELAKHLPDPIDWDNAFWSNVRPELRVIKRSVTAVTSVVPGKGISFTSGWYRLVCTNGMTSKILSLGGVNFSHTNFSQERLIKGLADIMALPNPEEDRVMGPLLGSKRGGEKFIDLLELLTSEASEEGIDDDDDVIGTTGDGGEVIKVRAKQRRLNSAIENLPYFMTDIVSPLVRLPKWYLGGLLEQFQAILDKKQGDNIYTMDALNAITNPVNLNPERSTRPIFGMESTLEKAGKLIGIYSMN